MVGLIVFAVVFVPGLLHPTSQSWDGTYNLTPSTVQCNAQAGDYASQLQQAVPAGGLVVSGDSIDGMPSGAIHIDSNGDATSSWDIAAAGARMTFTFKFTKDNAGGAQVSGLFAFDIAQGGVYTSHCTLSFTGTRG